MEVNIPKHIWFRVPRKLLKKLVCSNDFIDKKTCKKLLYYRGVLEGVINLAQHLVSVIDRILLREG